MLLLVFLLSLHTSFSAVEQAVMDILWTQTGKWSKGNGSVSNDACTWKGDDPTVPIVTCFGSYVYEINLSNKGLHGTVNITGALTLLSYLDLSDNYFSGNMSQILTPSLLPILVVARLANNQFTGAMTALPPSLSELDVSNNFLAFDVSTMNISSSMKYFNLNNNPGLFGTLNTQSLLSCASLVEFRISGISLGLNASNLTTLLTKQSLQVVEAVDAGITGSFPLSVPMSPTLRVLNLRNNDITGILPWSFFSQNTLYISLSLLDLSNNSLTGTDVYSSTSNIVHPLKTLLLANNPMSMDITAFFAGLKQLPYLSVLDISGNQFFGDLASYLSQGNKVVYFIVWVYHSTLPYDSLLVLNMSNNNLSGNLPPWDDFSALQTVDLSNNSFVGPLPPYLPQDQLRTMLYHSNHLKAAPAPNQIPSYIDLDTTQITQDTAHHFACPAITPARRLTVDVDWLTYFELPDYCTCLNNYVFSFEHQLCLPCPNHTICSTKIFANTSRSSPQRLGAVSVGFYPVGADGVLSNADPAGDERPVLVPCRHQDLCNPGGTTPGDNFTCAQGYDLHSLLCSRCDVNYFSILDVCYECTSAAILSPIMTIIFLVILTIMVLRKQSRDGFEAGTVQIVLTWVQITRILSEVHSRSSGSGPLGGDVVFPVLYSISVLAPVSIECTLGVIDYDTNLLLVFFAPLMFLCYSALIGMLAVTCLKMCKKSTQETNTPSATSTSTSTADLNEPLSCLKYWIKRTIFLWAFLLYAFYFQFCLVMFRALTCEDLASDPSVDKTSFPYPGYTLKVLAQTPYVRCDQDLSISPLAGFGTVFAMLLPPFVVGVVLFVRKQHPERWQSVLASYLGFLTRHLRQEAFLWDMTMVPLRKFLLALAIACYPRQGVGAIFMPLHVIGILLLCLLAQTWMRPYRTGFDNALETFLLAEQLLAFFLVVIAAVGEGFFRQSDLAGVETFVVFITWASTAVCIVAVFRPFFSTCFNKTNSDRLKMEVQQSNNEESSQGEREMQEKSTPSQSHDA